MSEENDIQLENGYTKIANNLLEKIAKIKMSGQSWQVLIAILRKTYGYNKKSDWIEYSQLSQITNLSKSRICESIKLLRDCGIITQKRNGIKQIISINKGFYLKKTRVTQTRNCSAFPNNCSAFPNNCSANANNKINYTKENITKENISPSKIILKKDDDKTQPIKIWFEVYEQIKKVKYYPSSFAEDTNHAKWILNACKEIEVLKKVFELYLLDEDKFLSKSGWAIRHLRQNFNNYYQRAIGIVPNEGMQRYYNAMLPIEKETK